MADFLNLPFGEQTDEQLAASRDHWERCVEDAAGWASAYAAAKQGKPIGPMAEGTSEQRAQLKAWLQSHTTTGESGLSDAEFGSLAELIEWAESGRRWTNGHQIHALEFLKRYRAFIPLHSTATQADGGTK